MLARTAENLYWMARYLERAENTARLIDSVTQVLLDLPPGAFGWTNLIAIAGLGQSFHLHHPQADEAAIMHFMIADVRNPSSVAACVGQARENARTLREMLPAEMWERINSLHLYMRENAAGACASRRRRYTVLCGLTEQCHAIAGLMGGAMARDLPYQVIKLGRNVERADMTTRMLDLHSAVRLPPETAQQEALGERVWMSTLTALSAHQTYRRLVSMQVRGPTVTRFLLTDARFPRSVTHCLGEVFACLMLLPRSAPLHPLLARMHERIARINEHDAAGLHGALDQLQAVLAEFHTELSRHYFDARSLAGLEDAPLPAWQAQS